MNLSDKPQLIPLAWATDAPSGERNVIPTTSTTPGVASLQYGFPEQCFLPDDQGGLAPAGADFNGALNLTTGAARYAQAGGFYQYDAVFSAAIGGYPLGAVLLSADGTFYWKNGIDSNTTSPDQGGAGWGLLSAMSSSIRTVSASMQLGPSDGTVWIDASNNTVEVSLPSASATPDGREYLVGRIDASVHPVNVTATDGISAPLSLSLRFATTHVKLNKSIPVWVVL